MPTVTVQLHHADTAVAHPRAGPDLHGMSVSLGLEGAVPSVLVLVASAPAALSVIAVRALATMNYGCPGHEILIHIPGAHDEIVERQMRFLRSADVAYVRIFRGSRRPLYSRAAARAVGRLGGRHGLPGSTGIRRRRDQAITRAGGRWWTNILTGLPRPTARRGDSQHGCSPAGLSPRPPPLPDCRREQR
jgi:hypothetical protein